MSFWPSDTFSQIADWCGIIGLLISIGSLVLTAYLTITAVQVRREFQDKVMIPVYLAALEDHCKNMKVILVEITDNMLIFAELGRIEGNLRSLRRQFRNKQEQTSVDDVLSSVLTYRRLQNTTNLAELNSKINSLTKELENKVRGLQWIN